MSSTSASLTSTTTSSTTSSTPQTSTSTSTSSTTSATSVTSGTTTSPAACVTTSPSNSTQGQELVSWLGNYTSLAITFQGTKNGNTSNLDFSYTIAYRSPTTYKVNLNIVLKSKPRDYTMWVLTNGTVLALLTPSGENLTGYAASDKVFGFFSGLETLATIGLQSNNAAFFHSTGNSTVTIGSNSFAVTNYTLNTTPETIQGCNGSGSATLTTYTASLGTPTGSSFELVAAATFVGSITDAWGTTTTVDYTYQVTGLTVG